jgi:hypothetical protein
MLPYAGQVLNTAFDPQQQLYQQYIQQVQDQTGAQMANTGVGSSPYGASVMGNTLGQANLGWQNAQLGRQLQGIQGASGALGAAGGAETAGAGLETAGSQLGQMGGQQAMAGGMLPYATLSGLNQGGMGALQGYIGAGQQGAQVPQTAIGDWMSYLTGGTGAQNVSNQAQMEMAKFTAQQQQQQYQNIASAIGGVAGLAGGFMGGGFGSMGGIFGGGMGSGGMGMPGGDMTGGLY